MKIQFEANQEYQLEAIKSVVDIFEGQTLQEDDLYVSVGNKSTARELFEHMAVGNYLLSINNEQLTKNVHAIQKRNNLPLSPAVTVGGAAIPASIPMSLGTNILSDLKNFTLEMETGTGKTYVYLRTIHELYKTYGFKKFIIVVPSVAIKEGVLKNLEITKEHFALLFNNPKMDTHVWNPKKKGQARAFATNDSLQIMVITIDSFTRAENIMHQDSDNGKPIEYIRATNPIVILDEPQNMETDIRKQAISSFNPLFILRYSATHKNPYNMVYKLDPVKAYDLGLVKKIEVDSVLSTNEINNAYIHVVKIEHKGKSDIVVHVEVYKDTLSGIQKSVCKLSPGDDLFDLTNREIYKDYILDRIDTEEQCIEFSNGKIFYVGQRNDSAHEEVMKYQIQRTIENHFEKEKRLRGQGIKVLSLFFIDKVSNYREYIDNGMQKGKFALWFEEIYKELQTKPKYTGILPFDATEVHNGYFSADKGGTWKDTKGDSQADDDTYALIMKDKERLLNPDVPLRFIFTHSALREGWDNPNVFQICTLNETSSEMKKRQEIGRGMRLSVNTKGLRVRDDSINILTVIANESYEDFAKKLQTEIEEETGVSFGGRIKNKRDRRKLLARKGYMLDDNFKAIWDRIKQKTSYHITFDTNKLIEQAVPLLSEVRITQPKITSTRVRLEITDDGLSPNVRDTSAAKLQENDFGVNVPDILNKIQSHTRLTRKTIFTILQQSNKLEDILINPQQVIDETTRILTIVMQQLLVDGIKYEKIDGSFWEMQRFENEELEAYLDNLVEVNNKEKTLYEYVLVDSKTIERPFAKELDSREDVKFYFKLPWWFKIDTPLGGYNPDWAIIFEGDRRIYFVAETKGVSDINDPHLTESEKQKIICGKKHFELFADIIYKAPIQTVQELID